MRLSTWWGWGAGPILEFKGGIQHVQKGYYFGKTSWLCFFQTDGNLKYWWQSGETGDSPHVPVALVIGQLILHQESVIMCRYEGVYLQMERQLSL